MHILVICSADGCLPLECFNSASSFCWCIASSSNGLDKRFEGRFRGRVLAIWLLSICTVWFSNGLRSTSKSSGCCTLLLAVWLAILSTELDGMRTEDVAGVFRLGGRSGESICWPELVRDRIGTRSGISGGRKTTHSVLVLGNFELRERSEEFSGNRSICKTECVSFFSNSSV